MSRFGSSRLKAARRSSARRHQVAPRSAPNWLQAMLEFIRPGDCIVICKLDRLARSLSHLLRLVDEIEGKKASLRSIVKGVGECDRHRQSARQTPHEKVREIFGCISEFERSLISERTKEGLVRAKALGRMRGNLTAETFTAATTDVAEVARARLLLRGTGAHVQDFPIHCP